jgi:hypothetical protein
MNGTPAAATVQGEATTDDDETDDPQAVFSENIQQASNALQTDPVTLAKQLNRLIKSNPEVAKQLLENG